MKVLIADDAIFLRTTLRHILEKNGHTVVGEASDGREAVELYKTLHPEVVTMDITMPVMNGIDALKEILSIDSHAQVLVCSAMGRDDFIIEAIKIGARGFITKPFREDALIAEFEHIRAKNPDSL